MKRARPIAAIVILAAIAYGAYRLFIHAGHLNPAIVTPQMDAQQMVSTSLEGRVKRLVREHITYNNRTDRPKLIALTFDDGPYPVTSALLLDELNALKIHATFFLIGHDALLWPRLAQRIVQSGDEIGDHTLTHPNLDQMTDAAVRAEIAQGGQTLWHIVHQRSVLRFFRPPHGRYTLGTIRVAQSLDFTTVLWNDDAGDWRTSKVTPQDLVDHIRRNATAPDIVLLHSGKVATVQMLPQLVSDFRAAGYRFVTVSQLLTLASTDEVNHPAKRPV